MKKYKLVNNENEEISFNIPLSNVIEDRRGDKPGALHISDTNTIFQFASQAEDDFDNHKYTVNASQDFKYSNGDTTHINTLLKHKGQTFLCSPQFGREETTETMPNMYSEDWIAISDIQHGKFIGRDTNPTELGDYNRINNGNAIEKLFDTLISYNFYDYFNDGDWYALTTLNGHVYTMRLNYNEWVNKNGKKCMSVDAISDEVIPIIRYKVSEILEKTDTKSLTSLERASNLSVFGRIFDSLQEYRTTNLTGLHSFGLAGPYIKWRYYHGYDRTLPLEKGGVYTTDSKQGYYLDQVDSVYKKNMYEVPNIWLPNEKEVFGVTYNCVCPEVEAAFKQYKTLDTAFKRVKTLNGKPVPWMTLSMHKSTPHPIIVDSNGNELSYEYWAQHGGFDEYIYLPLCVTLLTIWNDNN